MKVARVFTKQIATVLVLFIIMGSSGAVAASQSHSQNTKQKTISESSGAIAGTSLTNSDPLEPVNRVIWTFNYDYLDKPIYRPVVHSYAKHVPFGVRHSLEI